MAHIKSALILLSLFSVVHSYVDTDNGGRWGTWGPVERCPDGYKVRGVSLKVEEHQGKGDDTAVNGIRFHCFNQNNAETTIQSAVSQWGYWGPMIKCSSGHVVSYQIKVEPPQGKGDDTALNNIRIQCSNEDQMEAIGSPWGSYGSWSFRCNSGACGMQTKVELPQGRGDDTAHNDMRMYCCD